MSLFTKLFNLFNGGKKCEEKKPFPFRYGDRVRVVEGFYKGQVGIVCNNSGRDRFLVNIPSTLVWVSYTELEKA